VGDCQWTTIAAMPQKRERPRPEARQGFLRKEELMAGPTQPRNFEEVVLPHLNAAYNLARWLTRNDQDAQDAVQEAYLRAFRFFEGFRGGDARSWLLKIVRNSTYTLLQKNRPHDLAITFDEAIHGEADDSPSPETLQFQHADSHLLADALKELPLKLRELLVLREFEGLSYREIAEVADIPLGTVMSSLCRARERLRDSLVTLRNRNARSSPVPAGPSSRLSEH
jgi:RNA polymerase sigma-70 factor, ECF subfamily